jgi:sulfane dehydrogenase subunit SoxC
MSAERNGIAMDPVGFVLRVPANEALQPFLTPASEHYVVAHHGIARCERQPWTLVVDGLVAQPLRLTTEALRTRPRRRVTSLLECVGNPLEPDRPHRIVSNACWSGVSLADLLREAGPSADAKFVWLHGEDAGEFAGVANSDYVRDIPLAKARDEHVIVADEMNGEPLSAEHGFPLRALVAGWYGTNSVKWLSRISLRAERPTGFYRELYDRALGEPEVPAWSVRVNARITQPADGAALVRGSHEIRGWAWADAPVTRVEVSTDGGEVWHPAVLEERASGRPWQGFRFTWAAMQSGEHQVLARAYDAAGNVQPTELHINQIHRVRVTVAA